MKDTDPEQLIALADVPSRMPRRRGKKVHYSTVYRWATKGTRGRVLPTRLIGGVRYTSHAAEESLIAMEQSSRTWKGRVDMIAATQPATSNSNTIPSCCVVRPTPTAAMISKDAIACPTRWPNTSMMPLARSRRLPSSGR